MLCLIMELYRAMCIHTGVCVCVQVLLEAGRTVGHDHEKNTLGHQEPTMRGASAL